MDKSQLEDNTRVVNASSILRENLSNLESSDLRALQEAGLISKQALDVALSMKNGLKRAGEDYRKDERFKRLLETQISHRAHDAVDESNLSVMAHLNGRTGQESGISQFHRIKQLKNILTVSGRTFIFKGEPDMGKTNLALLMAEIWQDATGGKVITNMESVKQFKTVSTFDEWKKEFEESDDEILGIVEDASNHFSAYAVDRQEMEEQYRPFSNELAKNNGVMFLLGHTGMDIHADARRKSLLVDKPSVKKTEIYRRIKDGKGKDKLLTLTEIPKTSVKYDSTEKTRWVWSDTEDNTEAEQEAEMRREIIKQLKTNTVVKTVDIPYNNSKVADIMRKLAVNAGSDLIFDESASPKRLKKKVI